MKTVFVTHKDDDLHPTEKLYDHRCWTGVRLTSEYLFLVKGESKKGVVQRFMVGHPRRAVEKAKELSSKSIAHISLAYWPEHADCWSTQPVRYIFGNPSQTEFKVKTDNGAYSCCDHHGDTCEQAGPFWLVYSNGEDAGLTQPLKEDVQSQSTGS